MVASLVANEALAMSEPVDVTIGGLTGKQFDVRLDPDWTENLPWRRPPQSTSGTSGLGRSFSTPPIAA